MTTVVPSFSRAASLRSRAHGCASTSSNTPAWARWAWCQTAPILPRTNHFQLPKELHQPSGNAQGRRDLRVPRQAAWFRTWRSGTPRRTKIGLSFVAACGFVIGQQCSVFNWRNNPSHCFGRSVAMCLLYFVCCAHRPGETSNLISIHCGSAVCRRLCAGLGFSGKCHGIRDHLLRAQAMSSDACPCAFPPPNPHFDVRHGCCLC